LLGLDPVATLAVLDTSVLMSEHRHWLWLLARQGYYRPVWSPFIVNELVRIRVEKAIERGVDRAVYRDRVNELIHVLSDVCRIVNHRDARPRGSLRDPDDEPILATALVARAAYIVSLNTRDFPPTGVALGVRFVTPTDCLADLITRNPAAGLENHPGATGRQIP
jgi:predicted nucleic acid-binding protein